MAMVRVAGKLLHEFSIVGDLDWSHDVDGGCRDASWSMSGFAANVPAPFLRRGATVEVFEGLRRVWLGVLTEPGQGAVRECFAHGMMSEAARFMAFTDVAGVPTPTTNVDAAITQAIADGWNVTYTGDAPAGVASEEPQRLDAAIFAASTAASKRATVRADGVLRFETDATTPSLVLMPGVGELGRADEDYVTHVVVYYVKSVSGTPPVADDWGTVTVANEDAATLHGRSTSYVDLTERGVLAEEEVTRFAAGLLARGGARLSFTSGLTVTAHQLRTLGLQALSLAAVDAGVMVRLMGVRTPELGKSSVLDVVVGSTSYRDGSGEITLNPVGLAARNLADVIASIPTQGPSKIVDRGA